jgi:hypothetical protein
LATLAFVPLQKGCPSNKILCKRIFQKRIFAAPHNHRLACTNKKSTWQDSLMRELKKFPAMMVTELHRCIFISIVPSGDYVV